MIDAPDRALRVALERFVMQGEFDRLVNVVKDASSQPRVPAGGPEGGQFAPAGQGDLFADARSPGPARRAASRIGHAAVGAAGDMGRVAVGAARGAGRAIARTVAFARNAWFTARLNGTMRRPRSPSLLTGPAGIRRQLAQTAATAAAVSAVGGSPI